MYEMLKEIKNKAFKDLGYKKVKDVRMLFLTKKGKQCLTILTIFMFKMNFEL